MNDIDFTDPVAIARSRAWLAVAPWIGPSIFALVISPIVFLVTRELAGEETSVDVSVVASVSVAWSVVTTATTVIQYRQNRRLRRRLAVDRAADQDLA